MNIKSMICKLWSLVILAEVAYCGTLDDDCTYVSDDGYTFDLSELGETFFFFFLSFLSFFFSLFFFFLSIVITFLSFHCFVFHCLRIFNIHTMNNVVFHFNMITLKCFLPSTLLPVSEIFRIKVGVMFFI